MWLLLSIIGVDEVAGKLALRNPGAAATALALLAIQMAFCMLRWRMVCLALGVVAPSQSVVMGWIGMGTALSQVLPSSIGGDSYRVLALGQRAGIGAATRTVVAERIAGLLTLSFLALSISLAALPYAQSSVAFSGFAIVSATILAGGVLAGALARLLARWTASRFVKLVASDFAAMYSKSTLVPVFGFSLMIHALSIGVGVCIGGMLALDEVLWWQIALAMPGTLLVSSIPISLGGWGFRESSMVLSLAAFGVPSATALALSIGYGLTMAAAGGIGLCLWFATSQRRAAQ